MDRKRKLPARAAARAEQAAKRRTLTPPQRSVTPAPAPEPEPEPAPIEEAPQRTPLPKSVVPGKPLPTVDSPQPDDLSINDFQTIAERYTPPGFYRAGSSPMANSTLAACSQSRSPGRD